MPSELVNHLKNAVDHIEGDERSRQDSTNDIESKRDAGLSVQEEKDETFMPPISEAIQRKYMRKLDCIVLPTISVLYFFELLGRGNIAVSYVHLSSALAEASNQLLER